MLALLFEVSRCHLLLAVIYSDVADTCIKTAGPDDNPLYNMHLLA